MPRRPRVTMPGIAHHLIQRGNNRQACFHTVADHVKFLTWLQEYAEETHCSIHAYVLMSNHVHLLVTPMESTSLGAFMKKLGQRYVQYFNQTYKRTGSLWEGRFRSCVAAEENYVLACYRYIELNPVRAGMVAHPREYRWSSYGANGGGERDDIRVATNGNYALGSNRFQQQIQQQLGRRVTPGISGRPTTAP